MGGDGVTNRSPSWQGQPLSPQPRAIQLRLRFPEALRRRPFVPAPAQGGRNPFSDIPSGTSAITLPGTRSSPQATYWVGPVIKKLLHCRHTPWGLIVSVPFKASWGTPRGPVVKNPPYSAGDAG